MAEISAIQIYEIVEISAISQKFLFSHIHNKIPNIFCNHHFSIYDPHHGDLLWGALPPPPHDTLVVGSLREQWIARTNTSARTNIGAN